MDEEPAQVVRRIFQLAMEGKTPVGIAHVLRNDQVETPSYYRARKGNAESLPPTPYDWSPHTVRRILYDEQYLGLTINFKTNMPSYKSKRSVSKPKEEWKVEENTQEAIIDQETWRKAHELLSSKERKPIERIPEKNPLVGYVFCADCGALMRNVRAREKPVRNKNGELTGKLTKPWNVFVCKTYECGKRHHQIVCSRHMVHSDAIAFLIMESLRQLAQEAMADEQTFLAAIQKANLRDMESDSMRALRAELRKAERRNDELDRLIQGAYEANFKGSLTDERLALLVKSYEAEQEQLEKVIEELQAKWQTVQEQQRDGKQFLSIIRKVTAFEELTPEVLESFVEKVIVHEHKGSRYKYEQEIEIHFKFIGNPAMLREEAVHEFNYRV